MISNETLLSESEFETAFYLVQDCQSNAELNLIIAKIKTRHFEPEELEQLARQCAAQQIKFHQEMLNAVKNN